MTRAALVLAGVLTGWAGCASKSAPDLPTPPAVSFLADFNVIPETTFESLEGESLGGISGVTYDRTSGLWLALSDARSGSRFYRLDIVYDGGSLVVRPVGLTRFRDERGEAFADGVLDPEGIAETPWGTLLISTEADSRREPVEQAKFLELERDGRVRRRHELPEKFRVDGWPPERGVRHNLGFESLTVSPDGARVFVGGEASLIQDGPETTYDDASFCRIIEYHVSGEGLSASAEYAYPLGPVPPVEGFGEADLIVGLVELVALSRSRLLALERDYIREREGERRDVNRVRLFAVDLAGASDVSRVASLDVSTGGTWAPVTKTLLLDFDDIVPELSRAFPRLDNFEAMGLGPILPDGGRTLLVVSDDNFSDRQRTAFLLFSLKAVR